MSINTAYYGAESSWQDLPLTTGVTGFKVPCFYSTANPTYGNGSKSWIAGKFVADPDSYKDFIDKSCCWCCTDGTAPFDTSRYITGYYATSAYGYNRIEPSPFTTRHSIGLFGITNSLVGVQTLNYYYQSRQNSISETQYGNAPLKQKSYSGTGFIEPKKIGNRYADVCYGVVTPIMKFNFDNVFYTPIIHYFVIKDDYTYADFTTVDSTSEISAMVKETKWCDLHSFVYDMEQTNHPDYSKVVITGIFCLAQNITWTENGEIGSQTSGLTGNNNMAISNLTLANDTFKFEFQNWYKEVTETTPPDIKTADFDISLFDNRVRTGQFNNVRTYDERYNQFNNSTIYGNHLKCLCGLFDETGNGYYKPATYQYQIDLVGYGQNTSGFYWNGDGKGHYDIQYILSNIQLSNYADINDFSEYVKRMFAYLGGYFSESHKPNWHKTHTDPTCYLGIIDDNGYTHGDYSHGADNALQKNYNWGDDWNTKTPYKPNEKPKPVAPTKEGNSDPLTLRPNANIGVGMGLMRYSVKSNDLFNMGIWLNAVGNYNKAVDSFVSKYVTDNPSASQNKAMKAFKNVFPDVNSWYAYVYSKLGNGVHPNNNIVGLMAFPFETSKFGVGTATGILMGDSNTGSSPEFECKSWYEDETPVNTTFTLSNITTATGKPVNSDGFAELEMGSMQIVPEYGDFRDYAPYTKLELQIPFFGTVNLDPKDWYYHTVHVKCICECVTGSALCIVCREDNYGNEAPVFTIGGQIGFSIPMNIDSYGGTTASLTASSASFQNMNVEHRVNAVNGLIDVGKSTATLIGAGAFTVATGGMGVGALALAGANTAQTASSYYGQMKTEKNNIKATEYAMEHQQAGSMILGSASPSANAKYEYQCRLVRHYPCMLDTSLSDFIAKNGVACNETGTVGDYSGYAVFSNVKLDNIDLTDEEKKIIENRLQSGVYII